MSRLKLIFVHLLWLLHMVFLLHFFPQWEKLLSSQRILGFMNVKQTRIYFTLQFFLDHSIVLLYIAHCKVHEIIYVLQDIMRSIQSKNPMRKNKQEWGGCEWHQYFFFAFSFVQQFLSRRHASTKMSVKSRKEGFEVKWHYLWESKEWKVPSSSQLNTQN